MSNVFGIEAGQLRTFRTPYTEFAEREGQSCTVVRCIEEPDEYNHEECLPVFVVRFPDGAEISAWPEEIDPNARTDVS